MKRLCYPLPPSLLPPSPPLSPLFSHTSLHYTTLHTTITIPAPTTPATTATTAAATTAAATATTATYHAPHFFLVIYFLCTCFREGAPNRPGCPCTKLLQCFLCRETASCLLSFSFPFFLRSASNRAAVIRVRDGYGCAAGYGCCRFAVLRGGGGLLWFAAFGACRDLLRLIQGPAGRAVGGCVT